LSPEQIGLTLEEVSSCGACGFPYSGPRFFGAQVIVACCAQSILALELYAFHQISVSVNECIIGETISSRWRPFLRLPYPKQPERGCRVEFTLRSEGRSAVSLKRLPKAIRDAAISMIERKLATGGLDCLKNAFLAAAPVGA
jgi:hypothetical protein